MPCSAQVVGQISAWIHPDSPDVAIQTHSQVELLRELDWAAHQSLQAVIVPLPEGSLVNYAKTLLQVHPFAADRASSRVLHHCWVSLYWVSGHFSMHPEHLLAAAQGSKRTDRAVCAVQFMQSLTSLAVWISLPMLPPSSSEQGEEGGQQPRDPWAAWTMLRALCEHHTQLGIMLTVPDSLSETEVTLLASPAVLEHLYCSTCLACSASFNVDTGTAI